MPKRSSHPCRMHGWVLIPDGDYCPVCGPPVRAKDTRLSASKRGYGADHKRKRDDLLLRYPWCVDPYGRHPGQLVKAVIRDHIVPLNAGGKDDSNNQQSLCLQCHNYKMYHDGSRHTRGIKKFVSR